MCNENLGGWIFLFSIQHDPTPNNMANKDNDKDRNSRKRTDFNIDEEAFASDDDAFVSSDDDPFLNISQNKKSGNVLFMILRSQ